MNDTRVAEPNSGQDSRLQSPSSVSSYRNLRVWQDAMDLAEVCYRVSDRMPAEKSGHLSAEIRRSAVAVAVSLAEGWGRQGPGEFANHVSAAQGHLHELETCLALAGRVGLLDDGSVTTLLARTDRLDVWLSRLRTSIVRRQAEPVTLVRGG